jgi:effector-binding domain-containing protein
MRDYDAIKEALTFYAATAETTRKTRALLDAADAIEELVAAVPKWISVEERLPGKDNMVFVYYEWTGQSGTVYKEVSLSTLGEIQHFGFKLIAWMPLPSAPKEVE